MLTSEQYISLESFPLSLSGNRFSKPNNRANCPVGAIARLMVYRRRFSEEEVERLCGTESQTNSGMDIKVDHTWEVHHV